MGRASREKRNRDLECFTDESGNTGNKLFDQDQPFFWTCTLVVRPEHLPVLRRAVQQSQRRLGVAELHANQLGWSGLDSVADLLVSAVDSSDAQLVYTRVEKRHLARLKFVDTVLDPGINKGVHVVHYAARALRVPLAHTIVESMLEDDAMDFWSAYERGDTSLLADVASRVRSRVLESPAHPRMKEVLDDALAWAVEMPAPLLNATMAPGDSPNLTAFNMLLGAMKDMLHGRRLRVVKFVHDEQNEFAKSIKKFYSFGVTYRAEASDYSLVPEYYPSTVFRTPVTFHESAFSGLLQLVDLLLWAKRRVVDRGDIPRGGCARLVQAINSHGLDLPMTRVALAEETLRLAVESEILGPPIPFSSSDLPPVLRDLRNRRPPPQGDAK